MIEFKDIWRTELRPDDKESVPPMKVTMKDNVPTPPRPYQHRYNKQETDFLQHTFDLLKLTHI